MTTKEWLNRGWKLNGEILELLEAKERAKDMACKVTAGTEGEKVQTSKSNTSEKHFVIYADYTKTLIEKIDKQLEIQKEIVEAISKVNNSTYRRVLTARYVNYKKWEQVALDMGYDYRHVYKLHGAALKAIEKAGVI